VGAKYSQAISAFNKVGVKRPVEFWELGKM